MKKGACEICHEARAGECYGCCQICADRCNMEQRCRHPVPPTSEPAPEFAVNEHGVYISPEVLQVEMPRGARYRFAVKVARGDDGHWRWGYSYNCSNPVGGGCGGPSIKVESHPTRTAALIAGGEWLLENHAKKGKCQKSIDALEIFLGELRETFLGDCGRNRPECPVDGSTCPDCLDPGPETDQAAPAADQPTTVPDRRRPRKGYLIARDKYWIWSGHYSHNPTLTTWGMTEILEDAYRFASLDEALDYWRSRHTFPADYEHCIWDGYLRFYEEKNGVLRRVMPTPPQGELF